MHTRTEQLLRHMSLREKVAQLSGIGRSHDAFGDDGTGVFGTPADDRHGIPALVMGHGITGVRSGRDRTVHATYFCSPAAVAATWDPPLYYQVCSAMALEMRALGQHLNLGPTLNIVRHPATGRNWESFSEDPHLISRFGVSCVTAMQEQGVICGPKHFACNNQETHRFDINNEVDERSLREIYLPAFRAAVVEGGALNIMGAYNRLNGTFMCENSRMLQDILRQEWGFRGFVLSDFGYGVRDTVGSANAGLNVEMHSTHHYGDNLLAAVKRGKVTEATIDQLLREKLHVMESIGLLDETPPESPSCDVVHCERHITMAAEVARRAPILLKNDADVLPLQRPPGRSIAVIGPNAKPLPGLNDHPEKYALYMQGGGSGRCYYFPDAVVSPWDGIASAAGAEAQLYYAQGCLTSNQPPEVEHEQRLRDEAVDLARSADDVVLVVGLSGLEESEGRDREDLRLPGQQEALIKAVTAARPDTIVVLVAGSYIDASAWVDDVRGLLFCFYAGERIGQGIGEVLFGDATPSGKLPISWPREPAAYPEESLYRGAAYSESGSSNVYSDGLFVGYRHFDRVDAPVLFPFGFGLSYTSFLLEDLELAPSADDGTVRVARLRVTNTGGRAGREVVQLYIRPIDPPVPRPVRELKGFQPVHLMPGQSCTVELELPEEAFAYYSAEAGKWVVAPGNYEVQIGVSSRDIRLTATIPIMHSHRTNALCHVAGPVAALSVPDKPLYRQEEAHVCQ